MNEREAVAQRLETWAADFAVTVTEKSLVAEAARLLRDSAKRGWIPVSERLPAGFDATLCLAYTPTDSDENTSAGGVFLAGHDEDEGWRNRSDTGCWEPGEITHWMPLPEAP